nr:heavy metal-associated domain-containing protein [Nocardioides ungokensis]
MTVTTPHRTDTASECTLEIGGMTCASCVGRVEKALSPWTGWSRRR